MLLESSTEGKATEGFQRQVGELKLRLPPILLPSGTNALLHLKIPTAMAAGPGLRHVHCKYTLMLVPSSSQPAPCCPDSASENANSLLLPFLLAAN